MHAPIPITLNRLVFFATLLLHVAILWIAPIFHLPGAWWIVMLLITGWFNIVHWGLIHEAIHTLLFPSTRWNEIGGRVLAIAMGTSFHVLRFGHLMHHRLNRQFHSEQRIARTWSGRMYYYIYLLFGLYASEVIAGWLLTVLPSRRFIAVAHATFLRGEPNVVIAGARFFYTRGHVHATRADVAASILLYGIAFYAAGTQWYWLLAFMLLRAGVISFMDNIYHFGTPSDNSKAAKELALPRRLSTLILHGNFHESHHLNTNVPWRALPQVHEQQQRAFDGGFFHHGVMQFAGPRD